MRTLLEYTVRRADVVNAVVKRDAKVCVLQWQGGGFSRRLSDLEAGSLGISVIDSRSQ